MRYLKVIAPVVFVSMMASCTKSTSERTNEMALARAYDQYLYPSDVKGMFSSSLTAADSERVINSFVDTWLKNKVLAHKAEMNLSDEEKNVQKKLDEYRNSLLIYKYQMKLVSERIDTAVTEAQIRDYYEKNKNNFELKKNLVQLTFVKINESAPVLGQVKNLFRSSRISDKEKLSDLCSKHANNFFLDDKVWLDFNEVVKELPIINYDQEQFLMNNKFLEIKEGNYIYLINIHAYRIKNSVSLIEFERDNIRTIILNERKIKLLKEMENNVIREAEMNKETEKFK